MKKSYILLLLACCCTFISYGQHFRAGFQGGVLKSRMVGIDNEGESGTGFMFGLNINYRIFKLEINYLEKGGKYLTYNSGIGWFDVYKREGQYIQFPMSVHVGEYGTDLKNSGYDFECGIAPEVFLFSVAEVNYVAYRSNLEYKPFTADIFGGAGLNFGDIVSLHLRLSWSVIPDIKRNAVPKGFFWQTLNNGHTITNQLILRFTFGKYD